METTADFKNILLFKTNINSSNDKDILGVLFGNNNDIICWNIDLEDCDRVLRIVSETLSHAQIIKIINKHGYECCELTD
jgi:ribosome maturation factor RimP